MTLMVFLKANRPTGFSYDLVYMRPGNIIDRGLNQNRLVASAQNRAAILQACAAEKHGLKEKRKFAAFDLRLPENKTEINIEAFPAHLIPAQAPARTALRA
jgi:hypothetical protein